MKVKGKSAAAAALLAMMVTAPSFAADRAADLDALGALSVSPQICGIAIDRAALRRQAAAIEADYGAAMFRANDRVAKQETGWTAEQRAQFCEISVALAKRLGVYRAH